MDKKLKAKWVKALRSGEYEQCTNTLRYEGGFCCLGVLRHIINPRDSSYRRAGDYDPGAMLTDKHLQMAGLTIEQAEKLSDKNDGGDSFRKIAAYVERCL